MVWLALRWRRGDPRARWLLAPAVILPALLALLDAEKRFYYLIVAIPIFAPVLAWAAMALFRAASRLGQAGLTALAALLLVQAAQGVAAQQGLAQQSLPPAAVYAQLRQLLPAGPGIVFGSPQLWIGMPERNFRSIVLPFLLALPLNARPVPFEAALASIGPRYVLMDPELRHAIATDYAPPFMDYLDAHHARVIGEVPGYEGQGVTVYELDP
jgi:hypothetical protein